MKIIAESYDSAIIVQPGATPSARLAVAWTAREELSSSVRDFTGWPETGVKRRSAAWRALPIAGRRLRIAE